MSEVDNEGTEPAQLVAHPSDVVLRGLARQGGLEPTERLVVAMRASFKLGALIQMRAERGEWDKKKIPNMDDIRSLLVTILFTEVTQPGEQ